jgi:hypothetical protein
MKKLFLFAIVTGISYSLHAQVYLGGSLSAWSKNVYDVKTNSVTFYPEVGYSFPGNWHVGLVVGFGQTETGDVKNSVYEFTPYAGYTLFQQGIAGLFVEGSFSFLQTKPHYGDAVNEFKTGLSPGLSIKLSDRLSMRAHFGFWGYQRHAENNDEFGIRFNAEDLRFGFHYSF